MKQTWWQILPARPDRRRRFALPVVLGVRGQHHAPQPGIARARRARRSSFWAGKSFPDDRVEYEHVIPFKAALAPRGVGRASAAGRAPTLTRRVRPVPRPGSRLARRLRAVHRRSATRSAGRALPDWPDGPPPPRTAARCTRPRRSSPTRSACTSSASSSSTASGPRFEEFANERGIRIIGDAPIFVAPDSSDVWANPDQFLLDADRKPTVVAGVPPDYFSAMGSTGATRSTTGTEWRRPGSRGGLRG